MSVLTVILIIVMMGGSYTAGYIHKSFRQGGFMADVVDFHEKFGLEYNGGPRVLEEDLYKFRQGFAHEELQEYADEQDSISIMVAATPTLRYVNKIDQCLEKQLDALVDLVYVVLGTAYLQFGRDTYIEAWKRVHSKNMQKVRCERPGDSKRGSTFDVIKPEGWTPPSHLDLIQSRHAPVFDLDNGA